MENENLVFRGNTFATKAVDTYMKMVGEKVGQLHMYSRVHTDHGWHSHKVVCVRRVGALHLSP